MWGTTNLSLSMKNICGWGVKHSRCAQTHDWVVSQFQGDFKARDKRMSKYLKVTWLLQVKFEKVKVTESPVDRIAT